MSSFRSSAAQRKAVKIIRLNDTGIMPQRSPCGWGAAVRTNYRRSCDAATERRISSTGRHDYE